MNDPRYLEALARSQNATPEQVELANKAVEANLSDNGEPFFQSAFGYACALTAIMQLQGKSDG